MQSGSRRGTACMKLLAVSAMARVLVEFRRRARRGRGVGSMQPVYVQPVGKGGEVHQPEAHRGDGSAASASKALTMLRMVATKTTLRVPLPGIARPVTTRGWG